MTIHLADRHGHLIQTWHIEGEGVLHLKPCPKCGSIVEWSYGGGVPISSHAKFGTS